MNEREVRDFIDAMIAGTDIVGIGWRYRIKTVVPMIGRAAGAHGDAKLGIVNIWHDGVPDVIQQTAYRSDLVMRLIDGSAALATDLRTRKGV